MGSSLARTLVSALAQPACAGPALLLVLGWGCGSVVASPIRAAAAGVDARADGGIAAQLGDAGSSDAEVDAGAHCAAVAQWPDDQTTAEHELVQLINRQRTQPSLQSGPQPGTSLACSGARPLFGLRPLVASQALRCSARLHTLDMLQRHFFSQVDPDGSTPGDRIAAAGGPTGAWGEAVVSRRTDPVRVLESLMMQNQGCQALTSQEFTVVGVGYSNQVWTIDFAGP